MCLLGGLVVAGFGLSTLEASTSVPSRIANGGRSELEGEVEDLVSTEQTTRLTLAVARADGRGVRFRANLYLRGSPGLRAGQRVRALARLHPYEVPANPGQADFRPALTRRGVLFTGSVEAGQLILLSPASAWQRWLARIQGSLSERVRAVAPSAEAAALYLTLAAGLRAELGDELEARFAASGLAHVLSISGLHVAALALMLLAALRWIVTRAWPGARRVDPRRVAGPLAIPLVWAYVVFTGSQPPAIRSAVMASVLFFGMGLWRRPDSLNSLALAALAIVAVDPASVADLSLQLSFLAVLSLVLVSPAVRAAIPIDRPSPAAQGRVRYRLRAAREEALQTLCASIAVTLTGLPLIAATFHRLSLAGLVSNIVCLPLCGVLTALSAGGSAVFLVSPALATPVLWAGTWASQLLVWLVNAFAAMPGASFAVPSLGAASAMLFELGAFCFALARGRGRWLGLLTPGVLAAAWVLPEVLPEPALRVTFLSVGQGDAILVSSDGHHLLIDGGGAPGGADTGKRYVLPFLRERGVRSLDLAVLSHPHPDHALGLISTLKSIPARHLWIGRGSDPPPPTEATPSLTRLVADAAGLSPEEVSAGHAPFALGKANVEILGPPAALDPSLSPNDRSIVLLVRTGEVSFLLPGDVEAAGEAPLAPPAVTVVKAPHHGSRTSSGDALVRAARPRYVVFCVGVDNRFHFPSPEVEARYRAVGARCLRTDLDGAIEFVSDGRALEVTTFRERDPLARPPADAQGESR